MILLYVTPYLTCYIYVCKSSHLCKVISSVYFKKYVIEIMNVIKNLLLLLFILPEVFLCHLRSIAAHRDHIVLCLSHSPSVCLSGSHTFLVITLSYISQATHAFLGMLPFWLLIYLVSFTILGGASMHHYCGLHLRIYKTPTCEKFLSFKRPETCPVCTTRCSLWI